MELPKRKDNRGKSATGRRKKPVILIGIDGNPDLYFDGLVDAAKKLKEIMPEYKSDTVTLISNIGISCSMPTRKVLGFKFRYATPEEILERKKLKESEEK